MKLGDEKGGERRGRGIEEEGRRCCHFEKFSGRIS